MEEVHLGYRTESFSPFVHTVREIGRDQYDLNVEMTLIRGVEDAERDLVGGEIDVIIGQHYTPFVSKLTGHHLTWLAVAQNRRDYKLVTRPDIRSLAELRGKPVARAKNYCLGINQQIVLNRMGLEGEVTEVLDENRGTKSMLDLLAKGDVAGAFVDVPGDIEANRRGFVVHEETPALDIIAEQFTNKNRMLGRLEVNAVPEGRDWRIERLRIVNPESTFALDGVWHVSLAQPRTQVNLRLETSDIGKLLTRLGYPEGVRRGISKLEGALNWSGSPYDFDYPSLTGNLVLEAAKGQFVKLEPGIGKLLGILSLQALPRRIALDFRDVFSEGFTFDEIVGAVKINRGIASTDSFRMQGPPARIMMSGEVDLARETQKLSVRVTPHVSDTVSIAGALIGGPIAGVAAFLAQKMLKDPLDQAVSYEYGVTGTWADPIVSRIERQASSAPTQQSTPE